MCYIQPVVTVCIWVCGGNGRHRAGACLWTFMGPHEVRSCTICEFKLDPKKVTGTWGVAVTFCKAVNAWPARSGLKQTQWAYLWQRLPLKRRARQTIWILLNPFVFLPFSPPGFALCFYFVLFIFIPFTVLPLFMHPTMQFVEAVRQMFSWGRNVWILCTEMLDKHSRKQMLNGKRGGNDL